MLREVTQVTIGKVEVVSNANIEQSDLKGLPDGERVRCIQIYFKEIPCNLSHISFQNYYTARIRIDQVIQGKCSILLDNYGLMNHVHHEDDAQNWHILKREELGALFNPSRADHFIFYLTQPSPLWEKWEIRSIKFFETTDVASIVPKAHAIEKPSQENSAHLYRKYTVNTSGVALDSKDVSGHATRFMDLLGLLHAKLAKDVK